MTPERVELVGKLFDPYGNIPQYAPALQLVSHTQALQAFVLDMAAHFDRQPGPEKIAEYYALRARCSALRREICP